MEMLFEKKETSRNIQDNILFLGNRDDVYRLYQAMDVFVLPSKYEGLPVVGVEAQATGLPCVLSDKITVEMAMTECVTFQSIETCPKIWASMILGYEYNRNVSGLSQQFDICSQAGRLENFYNNTLKQI